MEDIFLSLLEKEPSNKHLSAGIPKMIDKHLKSFLNNPVPLESREFKRPKKKSR